jgi:hypothetical protein
MPDPRLTGPQRGVLRDALRAAFRRSRFEELLEYRLDRSLDDYVGPADDYPTALRKLIEDANQALWWSDLVREARNAVPGDPALIAFAEEFGVAPRAYAPGRGRLDEPQLELRIKAAQSSYDIATWRHRLGEIEGQVCRIEWPEGTAVGTGFLVGPSIVLTNYHVIEPIDDLSTVRLRFDYKVSDDGVTVDAGTLHRLAADCCADVSPYSDRDTASQPESDPEPDELDYALLRVEGEPGHEPVGGPTKDDKPAPRRWIEVPVTRHDFSAQPALYIVQHPDGRPLQVALDSDAVVGINGNGTRVRYTTSTEPGSSGSPCFGPDWDWVALHHAGDPKYHLGEAPDFNQGIPLAAIRELLAVRGKQTLLGGP